MKKDPFENLVLDEYEQEIEDNLGKYPLPPEEMAKEIALIRQAAINSLQKDERINIRINSGDLIKIKNLAANHGLKYQTFIGSILHKLSEGKLKEAH